MKKIILILFVFLSCQNEKTKFDYFELTYEDGWITYFSVFVDKQGNYISHSRTQSSEKHKLQELEFQKLKDLIIKIQEKQLASNKNNCPDCGKVALVISNAGKKKVIRQEDINDRDLDSLIANLKRVFKSKPMIRKRIKFLESEKLLIEPVVFKK